MSRHWAVHFRDVTYLRACSSLISVMAVQYLVILILLYAHCVALPIPFDQVTSEPQQPTSSAKRTLFNIIWTCISTTIICAWASVHPNVPPSGYWRGLRRRLATMFWTIIAPELILAWAVRQWFAAWEIMDTVNGTRGGVFENQAIGRG